MEERKDEERMSGALRVTGDNWQSVCVCVRVCVCVCVVFPLTSPCITALI